MNQEIDSHILEEYIITKKLGKGAYGHVWKVIERKTKRVFALKKICDAFRNAVDAQRTYREVRILHQLKHDNIVKLFRVIRSKSDIDLYLIFQVMEADLLSVILDGLLKQAHIKFIIVQLLRALIYLSSAQLVHRDIKPSNILISSDCHIKLCDFGFVRSVSEEHDIENSMTKRITTKAYRSPEMVLGSTSYSESNDMWSLGCVMAEMYKGSPLFNINTSTEQLMNIVKLTYYHSNIDIPDYLDQKDAIDFMKALQFFSKSRKRLEDQLPTASLDAIDLLKNILQFNPKKRITAIQALNHPFLKDYYTPQQDIDNWISVKQIQTDMNDNIKLYVKDYMILTYHWIRERYTEPDSIMQPRKLTTMMKIPSRFSRIGKKNAMKMFQNARGRQKSQNSKKGEFPIVQRRSFSKLK